MSSSNMHEICNLGFITIYSTGLHFNNYEFSWVLQLDFIVKSCTGVPNYKSYLDLHV